MITTATIKTKEKQIKGNKTKQKQIKSNNKTFKWQMLNNLLSILLVSEHLTLIIHCLHLLYIMVVEPNSQKFQSVGGKYYALVRKR